MQTGEYCRLPKTPRSEFGASYRNGSRTDKTAPRSVAKHYFDEHINTPSEYGDGSLYSAMSTYSEL
jgi:hypothetical protein